MDKSIPQVEYGQDIQEMARSADGPFSTRVPNSSDTALLYATVPDPSKPIEFKTSLEPAIFGGGMAIRALGSVLLGAILILDAAKLVAYIQTVI